MTETLVTTFAERGITVEDVADRAAALARIKEIIPAGASVMNGASETLQAIGFEDFAKSPESPWKYLRPNVYAEDDAAKRHALRQRSSLADYYLGSVHAVSETGQLLTASASGSQLAPYAFDAANVIWVVGRQKVVPDFAAAMKRLYDHVLPLHAAQWKTTAPGNLGKLLVIERESSRRDLRLLLVDEELGW